MEGRLSVGPSWGTDGPASNKLSRPVPRGTGLFAAWLWGDRRFPHRLSASVQTPAPPLLLRNLDRRWQRGVRKPGCELGPAGGAPAVAVLADPVEQGALKADVVPKAFRL